MTLFNSPKNKGELNTPGKPETVGRNRGKFARPKILLLDVDKSIADVLGEKWQDVVEGTLGTPYKVKKQATYLQLIQHNELSGHEESDIVIVDFTMKQPANGPDGEPHRPHEETDIWVKCSQGFVDNRIRSILVEQAVFDRVRMEGGIFIIFAAPPPNMQYVLGSVTFGTLNVGESISKTIWHITSELEDVDVSADSGQIMHIAGQATDIEKVLARYLVGSRFDCILQGGYRGENEWIPLAFNKFGEIVAMMRCPKNSGMTIVVPQLADKAGFVNELLENILPDLAPHLFHDTENGKWTHRPEYELPEVVQLHARKIEIEQQMRAALVTLDEDIATERSKNGWLHDLICETGDPLVAAVKKALALMGFEKIVDVDEIRDREGKSRREDLQIQDASQLLVIDIKGIGGNPSDDDATQANKHAFINAKELGRTDVRGLAIINHQRHLPPLDRENSMPFRQEMLDLADETGLGLMTAFDLYKIAVNIQKHGWTKSCVLSLLYENGRIPVVPSHYLFLGTVAKVMTGKFGVVIEANAIEIGDTLAIEGDILFEEVTVQSIQVDSQSKQAAKVGDRAGFLWPVGAPKLRDGMKVFVRAKAQI